MIFRPAAQSPHAKGDFQAYGNNAYRVKERRRSCYFQRP